MPQTHTRKGPTCRLSWGISWVGCRASPLWRETSQVANSANLSFSTLLIFKTLWDAALIWRLHFFQWHTLEKQGFQNMQFDTNNNTKAASLSSTVWAALCLALPWRFHLRTFSLAIVAWALGRLWSRTIFLPNLFASFGRTVLPVAFPFRGGGPMTVAKESSLRLLCKVSLVVPCKIRSLWFPL